MTTTPAPLLLRRIMVVAVLPAVVVWPSGTLAASGAPGQAQVWPSVAVYGPLAEVPVGHWIYASVERLIRSGVVIEYTPGLFDRERTITRYEAAMLVVDAFRRAGLAGSDSGPSGGTTTLEPAGLVEALHLSDGERSEIAGVIRALGQELAPELSVLGFAVPGPDGRLPEAARAPRSLVFSPGASVGIESEGTPQGATSFTSRPAAGVDGGVAPPSMVLRSLTPSVGFDLSATAPGLLDADARIGVDAPSGSPTGYGALVVRGGDQWLWARVGSVGAPLGDSLALPSSPTLTLEGMEARLLGNDSRTSVVVAKNASSEDSPKAIAVLDGRLALSRQVVVGAAIVRSGASPEAMLRLDEGETVTSLSGRYSPLPWVTITGEYAQNLWALPLLSSAMRLGAALQLGDVRLGARVGRVDRDFQPALGEARPGAEIGVDASIQMGDVEIRAGAGRLLSSSETGEAADEFAGTVGIRIGSLPGGMVEAGFELISVEDLIKDRRANVSVGWGTDGTQLSMGLSWTDTRNAGEGLEPAPALEASAAMNYALNPYASILLGYQLIDFGDPQADRRANASAQLSLRF